MSAPELDAMIQVTDLQPSCPVKVTERETLAPVPADLADVLACMELQPSPQNYRCC